MKDFKIIHDKFVYHKGIPYVYNIKNKSVKLDIFSYAMLVKKEIIEAVEDIEKFSGYIGSSTGIIYFNDFEKTKKLVAQLTK